MMNFPILAKAKVKQTLATSYLWIAGFKTADEAQQQAIRHVLKPLNDLTIDFDANGICSISSKYIRDSHIVNQKLIALIQPILIEGQIIRSLLFIGGKRLFDFKLTEFTKDLISPAVNLNSASLNTILQQTPLVRDQNAIEFTGFKEWRDATREEWVATSFFKISQANLVKLRKALSTPYDWSNETGGIDFKIYKKGDQISISGLMSSHAILDFDQADDLGLTEEEYDQLEESVNLTDLLKSLADHGQEIQLCNVYMSNEKNLLLFNSIVC